MKVSGALKLNYWVPKNSSRGVFLIVPIPEDETRMELWELFT